MDRAAEDGSVLLATEVTLFEFDDGCMPIKSLVDGIGTLTKGGLGVKATEVGLLVIMREWNYLSIGRGCLGSGYIKMG